MRWSPLLTSVTFPDATKTAAWVYRAGVDTSARLLGGAPLNPPLLLMLDEAGNIAPLQSLPKIAATGAGQGITLMTIWQDRAQIRELYRS